MSEERCPKCQSNKIIKESRLYKPSGQRTMTVGRWRIGCGATMFLVVLAVGIFAAYLAMTLSDATFSQLAMVFAALCLIFAANGLGMSIYFSRWKSTDRYTCQSCKHEWFPEGEPAGESKAA